MDRGDTGFILHESFKDLKTRRAEQEAYRKALEAQIMEKKRLQEQERERDRREFGGWNPKQIQNTTNNVNSPGGKSPHTHKIRPPSSHRGGHHSSTRPSNLPQNREHATVPLSNHALPPLPKVSPRPGGLPLINEIDSFNEPHPVAVVECMETPSDSSSSQRPGVPEFPPECMKYIQQVLPGFVIPSSVPQNAQRISPKEPKPPEVSHNRAGEVINKNAPNLVVASESKGAGKDQAFGYGSSSESSSLEDVTGSPAQVVCSPPPKFHVSQTSDQISSGVKVSRSLYKADLQKQIDERKKREEELRRKEQEEEERIQEKIRIEQERMQREYEEDLRKQKEKEKEAEKKRLEVLKNQMEVTKAGEGRTKLKTKGGKNNRPSVKTQDQQQDGYEHAKVAAESSSSAETIESIGEFFDTTMTPATSESIPKPTKYINPDDRVIPTIARMLKEKVKKEKLGQSMTMISDENCCARDLQEENQTNANCWSSGKETARIENPLHCSFSDLPKPFPPEIDGIPMPAPELIREISIRSAPCPSTQISGLEFLASLRSYLENEKSKINQRIQARTSKSTEKF